MNLKTDARLLTGSVPRVLLSQTGFMMIGFLSMAGFNVTDTWFVSRLGTLPLAAMSFTFPVVMLVHSLTLGVGVGTSAVVARAIGSGDAGRTRRLATDSLLLGAALATAIVLVGELTVEPLFRMLGAEGEVLRMSCQYMRIWYWGMLFVMVPMVGNNAIRATGDALWPSAIMCVDLLINIALDPLLIFGWGVFPALGIRGAALATVLCRMLALVASLYVLHYRKGLLDFSKPVLKRVLGSWHEILAVGVPTSLSALLLSVAVAVITRMVASLGPDWVAGIGAGGRVEVLVIIPMFSLGVMMIPFVAQNLGGGRLDRVRQALRFSCVFIGSYGLLTILVLVTTATPIAGLFSQDQTVRKAICIFLWIMPGCFALRGMIQTVNSTLIAMGRPFEAALLTFIRLFMLQVPLAWMGLKVAGYGGLLVGIVCSEFVSTLLAWWWIHRQLVQEQAQVCGLRGQMELGVVACEVEEAL